MPFWRNYYHLVWATKNREPLIQPKYESLLYGYIVNKGAEMDVQTYAIGGCADHIHLIVSIPPKHAVAYVVKNLKGASSHYVNHVLCPENIKFTWQNGYGCLTLGEKQRPKAEEYVLKQKQHHKESTTNSWLEHCEELDDGPIPVESLVESMHQIRETNPKYDLFPDDFPF